MAWKDEREPLGVAEGIALIALWFHIGVAGLEFGFASFTPNAHVRFLSVVGGLTYTAVAIGVQGGRPAAAVWGVALSALYSGVALGNGNTILTSQLFVLIPLLIVATRPRQAAPVDPRRPQEERGRKGVEPVWFPGPMDDPILARLRLPHDWD